MTIYFKILLFIALIHLGTANASEVSETIKRAQNATLQQDRLKAIQILVTGAQRSKSTADKKKLLQHLQRLSSVFYREVTQKKYLLAKSLAAEKDKSAVDILIGLNKQEPANLKIQIALMVLYLQNKDCKKALSIANESLLRSPYNKRVQVLKLNALYCRDDLDIFDNMVLTNGGGLRRQSSYKHVLLLRDLKRAPGQRKWVKKLQGNVKKSPVYLREQLISSVILDDQLKYAEKYLELCRVDVKKGASFEQSTFYQCDDLAEVEEKHTQLKDKEEELVNE